jgi:hypothetical protein
MSACVDCKFREMSCVGKCACVCVLCVCVGGGGSKERKGWAFLATATESVFITLLAHEIDMAWGASGDGAPPPLSL